MWGVLEKIATLVGLFAIPSWIWSYLRRQLSHKNFKKVFGADAFKNFHVIPGNLHLRPDLVGSDGKPVVFPYYKPQRNNPQIMGVFRTSIPVPYNETKSAKYIVDAFEKEIGKSPVLTHDEEVSDKLDVSFCSFGGLNNLKTMEVLSSEFNKYIELDPPNIIGKNEENKIFTATTILDYGLILKVHPKHFPNRVWIAIAGLDEWGTSGASWFLAKHWKDISKKANSKNFSIIVKVNRGQDESAEIVFEKYG